MNDHGFRHEALFYASEDEFLLGTVPFIRQGVQAGDAILVVESEEKVRLLRRELGEDASAVHFANMAQVGANPARIIPAWREFVEGHDHEGRGLRGIGEPIWAGRSADELVECQRHESLLNVAFGGGRPWRLLCPYDTEALPAYVIDEARRSHAYVSERHVELPSPQFRGIDGSAAVPDTPLRPAPREAVAITFGAEDLGNLRSFTGRYATGAGLDQTRTDDLVCAVNEIATNSVRHGGGGGTFLMWREDGNLVCEVRDRGRYDKPLADRERGHGTSTPRGLWLANQLCDLVQIRTYATGTVVRLLMKVRILTTA
ncbi:MAG TPA: sensor histidine kinase [Candidatus Dormibacteraeota bacterium]|nr:sensor histidine kinase [Candidatus Dormibacteraeota bacterium]